MLPLLPAMRAAVAVDVVVEETVVERAHRRQLRNLRLHRHLMLLRKADVADAEETSAAAACRSSCAAVVAATAAAVAAEQIHSPACNLPQLPPAARLLVAVAALAVVAAGSVDLAEPSTSWSPASTWCG